VAQFDADWWHQPVPSSPQSPQSAPNLQQPPMLEAAPFRFLPYRRKPEDEDADKARNT